MPGLLALAKDLEAVRQFLFHALFKKRFVKMQKLSQRQMSVESGY